MLMEFPLVVALLLHRLFKTSGPTPFLTIGSTVVVVLASQYYHTLHASFVLLYQSVVRIGPPESFHVSTYGDDLSSATWIFILIC